jgi:hypothetical protein
MRPKPKPNKTKTTTTTTTWPKMNLKIGKAKLVEENSDWTP